MLTYKFKMYSNASRSMVLLDTIDRFGMLYNHCIRTYRKYHEWYRKYPSAVDVKNHLTELKKRPYYAWIKALPSQAVQDVVERIDKAYKLYFRNREHGVKTSRPKFKKIIHYKSFTLKQAGYKFLENNKIRIGKRIYKYVKSRNIEGDVKTVTIKRDNSGNLWLVIVTDYVRSETKPTSGKSVGFDFGLKTFLVGSDKTTIDFPLFLKTQLAELKKLNRALSRKKKDSNNREKARLNLARFHQRVQNQRNDHQWKLARFLLSKYDLICLEDLNLKGMSKLFGGKLSDYGFYSFVQKLKYLAMVFRKRVVFVDRFFASSKTCSNCGYKNNELKLKDREWVCPSCGQYHDRDFNAAVNILREGASSLRLGNVIPSLDGCCCSTLESPML